MHTILRTAFLEPSSMSQFVPLSMYPAPSALSVDAIYERPLTRKLTLLILLVVTFEQRREQNLANQIYC